MNKFRLNCCIKTLDNCIIPAVAFAAHAARHAMIFEQLLKRFAGVLTTAIGMMQYAATRLSSKQRHAQRIENERFLKALAHRSTDYAPRTEVENYGEIEPSFHSVDIRYVRSPHAILGADLIEQTAAPKGSARLGACVLKS